jgi:hypothetical protein
MAASRSKRLTQAQWLALLRSCREEAAKHPRPGICRSFAEYRWHLDRSFGGFAPRAGELHGDGGSL